MHNCDRTLRRGEGESRSFYEKTGNPAPGTRTKGKNWLLFTSKGYQKEREEISMAVRELLGKWNVNNVSFIGRSIMKILTVTEHIRQVSKTVKVTGMTQMVNFNIFDNRIGNRKLADSP